MRRRSKPGREPVKARRRKAVTLKRGNAPKAPRRRDPATADLQEQLDRRTRELNEALEQQTATADVLQVISRSTFDLHTVLDTLLKSAVRLCDADAGTITQRRNNVFYRSVSYGLRDALAQYLKDIPVKPRRDTCTGRALLEGRAIHIPDVQADPDYTFKEGQRLGAYRTMLGVPMLREGIPVGVLTLSRSEVRPFSDKQIKLVTTFADQAAIAIENVRLFEAEQGRTRELSESLQQQTATADVLKVISRSTFDLQTVLNTLVVSAVRLCAADRGFIFQLDGDLYRLAANYGFSPEAERYALEHPHRADRGSVTGRVALEGRPIHIPDTLALLADPEYQATGYQQALGYRTAMGIPLRREGTTIGVFALTRDEVNPFTDKQIELVTTFADQAVIAIENVRLFEAEQQRTRELSESLEQQTATSEVLQVISSSPGDLAPVFESMLEKAVRICDAKCGYIYRWDGDALNLVAAYNVPPAFVDARRGLRIRLNPRWPVGRMLATKTTVHVADCAAEPLYTEERDPLWVEGVELGGIRTLLAVPMLQENELVGAFIIYRQEVRPFSDKQIALVSNFAAQAVIALENTRLLNELENPSSSRPRPPTCSRSSAVPLSTCRLCLIL